MNVVRIIRANTKLYVMTIFTITSFCSMSCENFCVTAAISLTENQKVTPGKHAGHYHHKKCFQGVTFLIFTVNEYNNIMMNTNLMNVLLAKVSHIQYCHGNPSDNRVGRLRCGSCDGTI